MRISTKIWTSSSEILLKRYLEKVKPKLIILDVYPGSFSTDGVESGLDLIANGEDDLLSLRMAYTLNSIKIYNALIFDTFRESFGLNQNIDEKQIKNNDKYIKGGFVEKLNPEFNCNFNKENNIRAFKNYQIDAFNRIIEIFRVNNIDYLLIQTPVSKELFNFYNDNESIDSYFQSKGPYFNFNRIVDFSNEYFYDCQHLNQKGVIDFNNKLISLLKNMKLKIIYQ